jgi:hypothetical protein
MKRKISTASKREFKEKKPKSTSNLMPSKENSFTIFRISSYQYRPN